MFFLGIIHTAQIGDYSLYSIHTGWLGLALLLAPVLLLWSMYVANKPQPAPESTAWRLNDGRWKRAKGRVRPVDWAEAQR
jgi:hypothetical protein